MSATTPKWDLALVGGGLANCLLAIYLRRYRPELRFVLLERAEKLGGEHTWSFHTGDLTLDDFTVLKKALIRSWGEYEVVFPSIHRKMSGGYHSFRTGSLAALAEEVCGDRIRCNSHVTQVSPERVVLEGGEVVEAKVVIDARGARPCRPGAVAFQKFLGLDLVLEEPHGLTTPMLMDARVPQADGFRFFYLLPWDERRVLIEDTRYSKDATIDREDFRGEVRGYAARRGWKIASESWEEAAALPIPLVADFELPAPDDGVPRVGLAGGFFHSTTGYSVPFAARVARAIVALPDLSPQTSNARLAELRADEKDSGAFFRFLNRMLFLAAEPAQRYRILERFHRLPTPLIERFYRGEMRLRDRARVLAGWPPVSLAAAFQCLSEDSVGLTPVDAVPDVPEGLPV